MRVAPLVVVCVALVMLLAVPSSAQWNFAYQKDTGTAYYSAHFPTSTIGYVVGGAGEIYKSTDGGDTWVQQTSPTTLALFDVFFLDANNGWAVGDAGVIIMTTDGTNWSLHPSSGLLTGADLNAIQFIGSNGWMGGDVSAVFITTDGGTTWIPPTTNAATDDVNDLSFSSATNGYAAVDGAGIMYTTDGGVNWTAASVSLGLYPYTRSDIETILAIDGLNGIATGWGSLIGPQPTIIITTSDGGLTWTSPDPTGYHWATYGYGYGLATFDNGEVILTGGGSSSAGFILHSTDNGLNWTTTQAFTGEDCRFAATVPGTDRAIIGGDEGNLAVSTDRGVTWAHEFDPGTGFAGWMAITNDLSNETVLTGANGHMIRLFQDNTGVPTGAYDFTVISPQNWAPTGLQDIQNVGGGIYYVSGSNGYLCKSTDSGYTWTELRHVSSATDAIYKMWWFDATNGILVGEIASQETIWNTDDGGATLNVIWNDSTGTSLQFNSISFAPDNPSIGVVCGDDTAMVYTTDGGATWTWANFTGVVGSKPDLEEVHMVSATDGWSVGDAGTVLFTTDGGVNWTQTNNPSTAKNLMDVEFRYPEMPDQGWICGDDQTFFYTEDGGATWTAANPTLGAATQDINAVYWQGAAGNLWIGADEAQALYRHNDAVTAADDPVSLPYTLGQNFPNPFNPMTSIALTLPADDHVTLDVYDVSGKRVASVLNQGMEAGDHTIRFNAQGLASGIYFYRLTTSAGTQTRKMVLLR